MLMEEAWYKYVLYIGYVVVLEYYFFIFVN